MNVRLFRLDFGRCCFLALAILAIAARTSLGQASHAQIDSSKPPNSFILDSAFLGSLYPDVSFQFGASEATGMAGMNPLLKARDKIIRDSGFAVSTPPISTPQTDFEASVRIKIVNNFGFLGELNYSSNYTSLSLSAIYTVPSQWVVPYFGFGVGYYAFSQQFNYGVSHDNDGYFVLDDIIYSYAAFGSRLVAGLDLLPLSSVGFGFFGAFNSVTALKDQPTGASVNLSGYEFGLRIALNFWMAHGSAGQGN